MTANDIIEAQLKHIDLSGNGSPEDQKKEAMHKAIKCACSMFGELIYDMRKADNIHGLKDESYRIDHEAMYEQLKFELLNLEQ